MIQPSQSAQSEPADCSGREGGVKSAGCNQHTGRSDAAALVAVIVALAVDVPALLVQGFPVTTGHLQRTGCMSLCFECDDPAEYDHHVVPQVRGGRRTVPLCAKCHAKAHHRDKAMTSGQLTREGLAKAKARGVKLGSARLDHWKGREHLRGGKKGSEVSAERRTQRALEYDSTLMPLLLQLREEGLGCELIAARLNELGLRTRQDVAFVPSTVWRIFKRAGISLGPVGRRKAK